MSASFRQIILKYFFIFHIFSRNRGGGRRSEYRVLVTGLPPTGSWQDLKDHMREAGDVCFTDVYKVT